jgi:hypothetical protein
LEDLLNKFFEIKKLKKKIFLAEMKEPKVDKKINP